MQSRFASILDPSASAGGLNGSVTLNATQAGHLLAGNTYINVHTSANGAGEIRGNLIAVPEPSSVAFLSAGLLGCLLRRRR